MTGTEFNCVLARHVRQSWINCGRDHAELVAKGFEKDFSITLTPGDLMRRAEQLKDSGEMPG